jgi:hypothetical protein
MTTFTYFEPLLDGHCTFWANLVLTAAVKDARISRLRLVTSAELVNRLDPNLPRIETHFISANSLAAMRQGGLMGRGRTQWAFARAVAEEFGGNVFLPFFDHAVVAAALDRRKISGRGFVNGIIFRPPNRFGLNTTPRTLADAARRWATYSLASRRAAVRLFTFDEAAPVSRLGQLTGALHFLPDPTPNLSLLDKLQAVPRPDGRRVALLFGALTERKGLFQIIEAWERQSEGFLDGTVLRLVGRLGSEERPMFEAALAALRVDCPRAVIELVDRYVEDSELAREVVNASLILAPYQNHVGSSGALFWAAAAQKPILTQNTGLIGYQTSVYKIGRTTDCTNVVELGQALAMPWEVENMVPALIARHSPENSVKILLNGCLKV